MATHPESPMDSTLSPKDTDPHHDDHAPAAPEDIVRAQEALAKLVQEAARPATNRRPGTAPARVDASDFSVEPRGAEPRGAAPAIEIPSRWPGHDEAHRESKPGRRRGGRGFFRFLCAVAIGIAATLAWQSYGEDARQMIATYVPALGPVSPPGQPQATPATAQMDPVQAHTEGAAPVQEAARAPSVPAPAAPTVTATTSPELAQEIKAMARDLAAMRQSVERLTAGQDEMSRTVAKLQTAGEELRQKLASAPPQPPARRPVAKPASPPPQALAPAPRPLSQSFAPAPVPVRPPGSMP